MGIVDAPRRIIGAALRPAATAWEALGRPSLIEAKAIDQSRDLLIGAEESRVDDDIGNLSGRARLYRYTLAGGGTRHAEGVAVSKRCDLVIAVIVGNLLDERERTAAYRHLESSMVQDWISQQLDGR